MNTTHINITVTRETSGMTNDKPEWVARAYRNGTYLDIGFGTTEFAAVNDCVRKLKTTEAIENAIGIEAPPTNHTRDTRRGAG